MAHPSRGRSRGAARRGLVRVRAAAALGCAAILAAAPGPMEALAQSAPATPATKGGPVVRIEYQAAPGCPDEDAFRSALRAQVRSGALSGLADRDDTDETDATDEPRETGRASDEPARILSVHIAEHQGKLRGRLLLEEPGGASSAREVTGASCPEVVSALALVAALALDAGPSASTASPTSPGAPGAASPRPTPRRPPRGTVTPRTRPPEPETEPPQPSPPPETDTNSPTDSDVHWEMGAHAGAFGAVSPNLTWGAMPFLDRSVWERGGLAPSFRLGVIMAQSPTLFTENGTASFQWVAARLTGCPLAAHIGPLTARPCAGLDIGALRGLGSGVTEPQQVTRPWVAAIVEARLQWVIIEGLVLDAEAGVTAPLILDTFVFQDPTREIHVVPALGGFVSAGIAARFR